MQNLFDGTRDLTGTRDAGFTKILARDVVWGKNKVFGKYLTQVRDAGLL